MVVGHIPVEVFLLANNFFDATDTSNRMFFKGQANFRQLMTAFPLALESTNRLSNRHSHMLGWELFKEGLIRGGLIRGFTVGVKS